jgi:hypothetical protein
VDWLIYQLFWPIKFYNNMQQILVYFALGIALSYLYNKFFGKKKPKKNCGDKDDCGCN